MRYNYDEIRQLRTQTGLGLRECVDAIKKYGGLEAALRKMSDPLERDRHEDAFALQRKNAERFVTLREGLLALRDRMFERFTSDGSSGYKKWDVCRMEIEALLKEVDLDSEATK